MSTIDQQFVEYIVKTLVNNPDKVQITRTIDEKGVLLSLEVDPEDVGRIIGRRGATAQSIRTLLRALGTKNDARYNLKIVNQKLTKTQLSKMPTPKSLAKNLIWQKSIAKTLQNSTIWIYNNSNAFVQAFKLTASQLT